MKVMVRAARRSRTIVCSSRGGGRSAGIATGYIEGGAIVPETKVFWLSFCDGDRPAGEQFLGVAIVDVTAEDAAAALLDLRVRFSTRNPAPNGSRRPSAKAWRAVIRAGRWRRT